MSISDEIVLMELGIKQQVGEPQDVYDEPDNLFVARFLGTPPINIFHGEIKGNKLFVANGKKFDMKKIMVEKEIDDLMVEVEEEIKVPICNIELLGKKGKDQKVVVGIRPEGFELAKDGLLELPVFMVETIGRDTSLVIKDPFIAERSLRIVVEASNRVKPGDVVKFNINPEKLFIFNEESGELL